MTLTSKQAEDDLKCKKGRSEIHSVLRDGEVASSNQKETKKFKKEFSDLIKAEDFVAQQVFDGDKIGLFLKKLSNRTFTTEEGKALPGDKPMKDSFDVW